MFYLTPVWHVGVIYIQENALASLGDRLKGHSACKRLRPLSPAVLIQTAADRKSDHNWIVFTQKTLYQAFFDISWIFTGKSSKIAFCATLWGTEWKRTMIHLWLVGKRVVNFLLVLNELFSLAITAEALWADIGWNCVVRKGGGSLWAQILGEGRGVVHERLLTSEI